MNTIGNRAGYKLFGTVRRTQVLSAISLLDETYPRELARLLNAPLITIQRVVDALEREAIVVTRVIGKERRVAFNPRFFAGNELQSLLRRLTEPDAALNAAVSQLRRRPRKKGKPV